MSLRTILRTGAILAGGAFLLYTFLGPQGLPAALEKHRQIQQLRLANAELKKENQLRRKQIQSFSENSTERDLRLREQLRLLKKGETIFIIQDPRPPERNPSQGVNR